jgi:DNA invertase Pin-like site-specific DNA recombinase
VELGYARVSTGKQDLDRQLDALGQEGIPAERIYVDKKSGATTDRPGLRALLEYARDGDVIVVHTLDRLGRTVRDTLNLIHDLAERGVGIRNLADPIRVDSGRPDDPMAQLAVVLLALFGQMERTYAMERAAHARVVATAKGRRVGRPVSVDASKLAWAEHLRDQGATIAEIVAKTGIARTSLYRHLPPRAPAPVTAAGGPAPARDDDGPDDDRPGDDGPGDTSGGISVSANARRGPAAWAKLAESATLAAQAQQPAGVRARARPGATAPPRVPTSAATTITPTITAGGAR